MNAFRERLVQIWGNDPNDSSLALQWLRSCVTNQVSEDLYLEFKRKSQENTPILDDADKGQLARAISGFANTDGGILIWGVYAKANGKEDPDVAQELRPIRGLKTFMTQLNSLCGQAVNPPLPGIENRLVWDDPLADIGFIVTVVPIRRSTLTQTAMGKNYSGQYFIRTGSGFFPIPQPLLAEFYTRRPLPILRLDLELAGPGEAKLEEKLLSAEHGTKVRVGVVRPWGKCVFRQELAIPWNAYLQNDGLGSASRVTLELRVNGLCEMSVLGQEPQLVYDDNMQQHAVPWPKTCFQPAPLPRATIKLTESVHPGQRIEVARGVIKIAGEAFNEEVPTFEIAGWAFANDSPPSEIQVSENGTELAQKYGPIFRERALPACRDVEEPPGLGQVGK